jgi:putative membrane protein
MRRTGMGLLAVLLPLGASACVESPYYARVADCSDFVLSPTRYHVEYAGRAGMVTQQELNFVCAAAMLGRTEVISARMAQDRASSPAVIDFAARAADEQQRLDHSLAEIAEQHDGVVPPTGLDAPHIAMLDQLAGLSGAAFDRAYLQKELQEDRIAMAVFTAEAASGSEPLLSKFAASAVPLVQDRLRLAQSIATP